MTESKPEATAAEETVKALSVLDYALERMELLERLADAAAALIVSMHAHALTPQARAVFDVLMEIESLERNKP